VKKRYTGLSGSFHIFLQQSSACGKPVKYVKNIKKHKKSMLESVQNRGLFNRASTCKAMIHEEKSMNKQTNYRYLKTDSLVKVLS
jgi:hypothetical protein